MKTEALETIAIRSMTSREDQQLVRSRAASRNLFRHARSVVVASVLAAVVTASVAVPFVGAQPVQQTGPTGAQCNLKSQGGDFVDPENSDTTNNANISLSPSTGSPAGTGPQMAVAGCEMAPPVQPPPSPTPEPTPTGPSFHRPVSIQASAVSRR